MPPATRNRTAKKAAAAKPPPDSPPADSPQEPVSTGTSTGRHIEPADVDTTPGDKNLTAVQAIAEVMRRIGAVGKDRTNDDQGFKFRGVDDLMNAAHPAMAAVGLVCLPDSVLDTSTSTRATRSGGTMYEVRVHVRFKFYGPDGSSVQAEAWGEGVDSGDKATSKAHTMAYKTCIYESFHVPTREASQRDPDSTVVEESRPVFPAEERWAAIKGQITEAMQEPFKAWWKEQGFPSTWAEWTDEQVKQLEDGVARFVEEAEKAATEAAQQQAGEPEPSGKPDAGEQPADVSGNEPTEPAGGEPAPPSGNEPPADDTAAAVETVQQALGGEVVGADEGPQAETGAKDEAIALEHRRRAKLVSGRPQSAQALMRLWKDGAKDYADVVVPDPTNTDGAEMPLWRLFVTLGYPPAGEGRG